MNKKNEQLLSDINELKDRVKLDINDFVSSQFRLKLDDFLDWFSSCLNVFEQIQLQNYIVKNFIFSCEKKLDEKRKDDGEIYIYFNGNDEDRIKVAFRLSELKILRLDESERIVPKYLINALNESDNYSHIVSSLELIEKNYEERNSEALNTEVITLLDSILNLDEDLQVIKKEGKKDRIINIGLKLDFLIKENDLREKFGVDKNMVLTLNNARAIRNVKNVHKNNLPIEFNTPFIVSMGFASLTILFLEMTLATGELIKD